MAVIGSLAVNIIAKLNPFAKGIDSARRKVSGLRGDVHALSSSLKTLAGLALGAVGVRGLGRLVSSSLESIDELSKLSQRTNIAVADLQVLGHGAQLTGLDFQQLTKSLQTFQIMIAKANSGDKSATGLFNDLVIDPNQLGKANPLQSLGMVADRLRSVKDAGERARLSLQLFGKAGGQMSLLLADGSAGLQQLGVDFEKVGTKISNEDAKRIEAFNDSLTRLKTALGGAIQGLVIDIAPGAVDAINKLADTIIPGIKAFIEWQKRVGAAVGNALVPTDDQSLNERLSAIPMRAAVKSTGDVPIWANAMTMGVASGMATWGNVNMMLIQELRRNSNETRALSMALLGRAARVLSSVPIIPAGF